MPKKKETPTPIAAGNIIAWRIEDPTPEIHYVLEASSNSDLIKTVDDLGNFSEFVPPRAHLTIVDPRIEKHPIVNLFIQRSLESIREQAKGIAAMSNAIDIISNIR